MTSDIIQGDCIEELKKLEENSVDSVVTDPPYGIGFMGKAWDTFKPGYAKDIADKDRTYPEKDGSNARQASEAMKAGKYDLSPKGVKQYQDWCYEWAKECLRVLKPGGHLLASNSPRMYHRMALAIEDAGFEIRDQIMWVYGSGFPKSLNIGKAVDKLQGNEREEYIDKDFLRRNPSDNSDGVYDSNLKDGFEGAKRTKGTSDWEGWGTALKPAHEPIVLARKPLSEKTVAENVLKWGTGGLNIDESRVSGKPRTTHKDGNYTGSQEKKVAYQKLNQIKTDEPKGRFPANLIHDGSDEVVGMFPETNTHEGKPQKYSGTSMFGLGGVGESKRSSGSAARFFYTAKASKAERNRGLEGMEEKPRSMVNKMMGQSGEMKTGSGKDRKTKFLNHHPTVKPISLMKYLIKLVTPKGGTVLDPFLGSGSTAVAAKEMGYECIGIEREEEYCQIALKRVTETQVPML